MGGPIRGSRHHFLFLLLSVVMCTAASHYVVALGGPRRPCLSAARAVGGVAFALLTEDGPRLRLNTGFAWSTRGLDGKMKCVVT